MEDGGYSGFECLDVPGFTFPYHDGCPAEVGEGLDVDFVVRDISSEFGFPVFHPGAGHGAAAASFMAMPEASIDEYRGSVFRQNDIRCARKAAGMKAESVSEAVEDSADDNLGLRIPASDPGHIPAACVLIKMVHLVSYGYGRAVPAGGLLKAVFDY